MPIPTLVPDPQILLEMQPEEVGAIVLQVLHEGARSNGGPIDNYKVARRDFGLYHTVQGYPQTLWPKLLRTLMEGWAWLENEGFLAPEPEQEGWYFITRKGAAYRTVADLRTYREAARFPRALLHPRIAGGSWGDFVRGEWATAVFKAFREVEIAVREAAALPQELLGEKLMRTAFGDGGPLADAEAEVGERGAMREFFAGAIGTVQEPA